MGCCVSKDGDDNVSALPPSSQATESKKGSSAEAKKELSAEAVINVSTRKQCINNEEYKEWLSRAQEDPYWVLREAPDHICNDPRIVIAAVQKYGAALEFASPELRNDRQVVMAALQNNGTALEFASPELRNDKEVVIAAVKNYGKALQYATPDLQNNKQVVMDAVQRDGRALAHASPEVQNDKEVVIAAVEQDEEAFRYASQQLRQDKDVRDITFEYWSSKVKSDGVYLSDAPDYIRGDKGFILVAVQESNGSALEYTTPELQNDREVVIAAVQKYGRAN